jgi:hypothetical protein
MATTASEATRLLALQPDEWLDDAADDILATMKHRWGLAVHERQSFTSRGAGGWCDGMSITSSGIVFYRPTGNRRSAFTLAHELAHNIVESDEECINWLSTCDDLERELEHLCDEIAARILLPRAVIDEALAGEHPSAAALTRLHDLSQASWSCCAIALAGRLPCEGFVALVDQRSQQVFFSARARDTRPYAWRDDTLPTGHTLRGLRGRIEVLSSWPRFNINEPRRYYLSADADGDWANGVFAENDLWGVEAFHAPVKEPEGSRHVAHVKCRSCGYEGTTRLYPCGTCREERCQLCGKCGCDRDAEKPRAMCKSCTSFVLPHLLVGELCPDCQ